MNEIDVDPVLDDMDLEQPLETAVMLELTDQAIALDTGSRMNSLWAMTPSALDEAKLKAKRSRMSHGMLAGIPLLCRKDKCVYAKVCSITPANRIEGQRCPMEGSAVIARFEDYCSYFDIDINRLEPRKEDIVDLALIKDLVDIEIQLLRADNKIAVSGDFIVKVVGTVDSKGRAYYEDALSQASEFKVKLLEKKWKLFQLLDSTRKDKANKMKVENDPSVKAASIFSKLNNMMAASSAEDVTEYTVVGPTAEGGE